MSSRYNINYQLRAHKRDNFIEFIKSLLLAPFILQKKTSDSYLEIIQFIENLVLESTQTNDSRLHQLVPSIGSFFTPLPLVEAFDYINDKLSFTTRDHIPPSFNDIRHLLNRAQIIEIAKNLKLITFDGDMTLYQDGMNFSKDSPIVKLIIILLLNGIKIAIVTAAGYPGNVKRYEERLRGLLDMFGDNEHKEMFSNFYVLGGECNYMFQYNPKINGLEFIPESVYQPDFVKHWSNNNERIQELLDCAEQHLTKRVFEMGLKNRVDILRKERAMGINPRSTSLTREQLDDLALSTQATLNDFQKKKEKASKAVSLDLKKRKVNDYESVPFCAFNGGSDVWVDIGNKLIGVRVLLEWLGTRANETLHVGDQVYGY
jgi:IMP and pyridine-specific 5'-nucleotidase